MNTIAPPTPSEGVQSAQPAQNYREPVAYVGFRVDDNTVVLNLSDHRRVSLERSLQLVNHSPRIQPKVLT